MTISANDAHEYPIYNARYRVYFPILDADGDLVAGATALDSERSIDGGDIHRLHQRSGAGRHQFRRLLSRSYRRRNDEQLHHSNR